MNLPSTGQHRWDTYQAFFDRYLMNLDNGFGASGKVEYFTIGANHWRHSPAWPPPGMQPTAFFLRACGLLAREAPVEEEAPDRPERSSR